MAEGAGFVSVGTDPSLSLKNLAESKTNVTDDETRRTLKAESGTGPMADGMVLSVSLGRGQENVAQALVKKGMKNGKWVLLQNCHLAKSWMQPLEVLIERYAKSLFVTCFTHLG